MGGASRSTNSALKSDHAQLLNVLMKRKKNSVVQTYSNGFLGFAARLSEEEAKSIAERSGVLSVFPDPVLQLHTTRSWDFLNSITPTSPPSASWPPKGDYETIIGILDSGIWPESASFNDSNMGPIPSHWKGTCMPGTDFPSTTCNRKVIGAKHYVDPRNPGTILTSRDMDGHGTIIASIAAGVPVLGASYYGLGKGIAKGGSPYSGIAVYTLCGPSGKGCVGSNILKAFDDAIGDGVDVMAIAFGYSPGQMDITTNPIAIGSLHAMEHGITVVCSGGNDGPSHSTVVNDYPWVITVAATTTDRLLESDIVLVGKKVVIKNGGIRSTALKKSVSSGLVDGGSAASKKNNVANARNCFPDSLDAKKVKGKIVLCESNDDIYGLGEKFDKLNSQGAKGLILIDENIQTQVPFKYGTSAIAIVSETDGALIRSYIKSTSNPFATILATVETSNYKPAPGIPNFSARGPPYGIRNLVKPDIVAPGTTIVGAWPSNVTAKNQPLFNILSGTSMSCPHVSGLAAVIKSRNPTWSPAAIKSAIMTTAIQKDNLHGPITTNNGSTATPYDMGSGIINLSGSLQPGLVYETQTIDYFQFLCNLGYSASVIRIIASNVPENFSCSSNSSPDLISDMNYPSIAVSGLKANEIKTVNRIVTNVGEDNSTYTATVQAPANVEVQVVPEKLQFSNNVKRQSFQVLFKLTAASQEDLFGSIILSNGKYIVRSPFVVSNA